MSTNKTSRLSRSELNAEAERPDAEADPHQQLSEIEWLLVFDHVRERLDDALAAADPPDFVKMPIFMKPLTRTEAEIGELKGDATLLRPTLVYVDLEDRL